VTDGQTDGRTDNADHSYSWLPHCGGTANKTANEEHNISTVNNHLQHSKNTQNGTETAAHQMEFWTMTTEDTDNDDNKWKQ